MSPDRPDAGGPPATAPLAEPTPSPITTPMGKKVIGRANLLNQARLVLFVVGLLTIYVTVVPAIGRREAAPAGAGAPVAEAGVPDRALPSEVGLRVVEGLIFFGLGLACRWAPVPICVAGFLLYAVDTGIQVVAMARDRRVPVPLLNLLLLMALAKAVHSAMGWERRRREGAIAPGRVV